MKIKDIPEQNRPRERFLKYGPRVLSDAELFAVLLRTGTPKENIIDVSNNLIKEYGLSKLFDCSLKELQQIKGIGPGKAMQILAMAELTRRINMSKKPIKKIHSAQDVFDFYYERLKDKKEENFIILMLNNQNNIIGERFANKGISDASLTHPREIFRYAIKNSANKIILIHNHPSGNPNPSQEDLELTEKIIEAGNQLGINVIDHVIIGDEKFWSWRDKKD